jgi:hypothetical protein
MLTAIKRLSFVVLVPAVVGVGAWAEWTTFTTDAAAVGTSTADLAPADVTPKGEKLYANVANRKLERSPLASAADEARPQEEKIKIESAEGNSSPPAIKVKRLPFVIERRSEDGMAAQSQAPAPAVKTNTETSDARPAPLAPTVESPGVVERRVEDGMAAQAQPPARTARINAESADVRPSRPAPQPKLGSAADRPAGEKTTREASSEAADQRPKQLDRPARDQRRIGEVRQAKEVRQVKEVRQAKSESSTQKAKVAKREQADFHPRRLGREDIDLRGVRAAIIGLRKSRSFDDLIARLDALGGGGF